MTVFVMGDFNIRFYVEPSYVSLARKIVDIKEPDTHGKELLDLCKGSDLWKPKCQSVL